MESAAIESPEFWENRYQEGTARWDLGQPAPPFVSLLASANGPKPGSLIALGMGRGHDALLFAEYGFAVTGVDFAPSAIAGAQQLAQVKGVPLATLQCNMFDLATEYAGKFDYVLEHTCFCAIAPTQRSAYVELVHALLKPSGEFIGLFWAHSREGGLPYGTTKAEICDLFSPYFDLTSLELVANSIPNRANEEYLARFRKLIG
ncbi:methyltransferase domain-containing protein [Leptolyngbya sp. AN02str]|uniref:methyltransferase domain-containing protein n=1 Tax=Leptolyngbya sp. AN02str TaxID=3423363 RepID=UPI003D31F21B